MNETESLNQAFCKCKGMVITELHRSLLHRPTPRLTLKPVKPQKEIWGYFHSDYYPESTDYTSDFGNYFSEYASSFDALDAVYDFLDDQPTGLKTSQSKI